MSGTTTHLGLPLPGTTLDEDLPRLVEALRKLDESSAAITATADSAQRIALESRDRALNAEEAAAAAMREAQSRATAADVEAHNAKTDAHGAAMEAEPGTIVLRDSDGRSKVSAPVDGQDIANKEWTESVIASLPDGTNLVGTGGGTMNLSAAVRTKLGYVDTGKSVNTAISQAQNAAVSTAVAQAAAASGACKAWCTVSTAPALTAAFNVTSVSRSVNTYTINLPANVLSSTLTKNFAIGGPVGRIDAAVGVEITSARTALVIVRTQGSATENVPFGVMFYTL